MKRQAVGRAGTRAWCGQVATSTLYFHYLVFSTIGLQNNSKYILDHAIAVSVGYQASNWMLAQASASMDRRYANSVSDSK